MSDKGWLEALAAGVTIVAGILAIGEYFAPRCPHCNKKLVIINHNYFCNNCRIYTNPKIR